MGGLWGPANPGKEKVQVPPKKSGGGSGKRGRSAVTGKFVKQSTVRKNPKTTVNESARKGKKGK